MNPDLGMPGPAPVAPPPPTIVSPIYIYCINFSLL